MAMAYQGGRDFGRSYVTQRSRAFVSDLTIDRAQSLPELQASLQAALDAFAEMGIDRRIDPAELYFHGTIAGKRARGYLYAATSRISASGAPSYGAPATSVVFTVLSRLRIASRLRLRSSARLWTSFETNPQWFRDNLRSRGRNLTDHGAGTSACRPRDRNDVRPAACEAAAGYARYKADVVPIRDPQTETDHIVQVGSNYYWLDERGVLVGPAPRPTSIRSDSANPARGALSAH